MGGQEEKKEGGGCGLANRRLQSVEEVAETGRKINTEATVSGWRLRYTTTYMSVHIDSFFLQMLLCSTENT